jgi:predicted RNase H-like nuclease (RuvC/YqgF family)
MPGSAIPVAVTGVTWTAILMGVANLLIGGLLVQIIRTRPTLKKINNEREANLLNERAKEMDNMRRSIAKLEAERATDRHRINNLSQCLDALLLMIEMDPSKAAAAAVKIKAMRATQMEAEAVEKAAIHAAEIASKEIPE